MKRGFGVNSGSSPANKHPLLVEQLNLEHPLVKLSQAIDWGELEQELSQPMTGEGGRPTLPTRLMVGLHYLKALYNESDESVVAKWVENPRHGNTFVEKKGFSISFLVILPVW